MAPSKAAASNANLKRKEGVRPAPVAKRPKVEAWASIQNVIEASDLSEETQTIILESLPLSLGEFADKRHKFQEQMVDAIGDVLKEMETSLIADVTNAQSERDESENKRSKIDADVSETAKSLDAKNAQVQQLKKCLANDALAFRSAKEALKEAEEAKLNEEFEVRASQRKKEEYATMLEQLEFLKNAAPEDPEAQKKNASLLASIKKHAFEDSMLIALPEALRKPSDARGQFDKLTIDGLQTELNKRTAQQDAIISAFAPTEQKLTSAIEQAHVVLDASSATLRKSASTFQKASDEQATCTADAAAAIKAQKDFGTSQRRLNRACDTAQAELEVFREGPLAKFLELKARKEPVPEIVEPVVPVVEVVERVAEEGSMAVVA
jgi:hypothetical protein